MSELDAIVEFNRARHRLIAASLRRLDLNSSAFAILDHMDRFNLDRASDVGDIIGVTNATLSMHFLRMERDGLIQRAPDLLDKRARLVRITEHGKMLLDEGRKVVMQVDAIAREGLDEDLLKALEEAARLMTGNLQEVSSLRLEPPDDEDSLMP